MLSVLSDAGTRIIFIATLIRPPKVSVFITWIARVEHTREIFESTRC
jgi:hypothetical protein